MDVNQRSALFNRKFKSLVFVLRLVFQLTVVGERHTGSLRAVNVESLE